MPRSPEEQRAYWAEKARRQRAARKAAGIKPKKRPEYIKAYLEKNREKYNEYHREWAMAKRREAGIGPKNPTWTKEQHREYRRKWDEDHREERREFTRKYRESNPEKVSAYQKKYNEENKEQKRLYAEQRRRARGVKPKPPKKTPTEHSRLYRSRHPEKARDAERKRRERDRESFNRRGRINTGRRRVRKAKLPGSHTHEEWTALCERFQWRCVCCGTNNSTATLARDHVIPITKPLSTDDICNIQPLCQSCNSKKGNRHTMDYRKTPFQNIGQGVLF